MFKKALKIMLPVFLLMFLAVGQSFAVQVASEGTANSSGQYDISISDDHLITFNGGKLAKYEVATTSDTLTVAESGKTILMNGADGSGQFTKFTLPDADVGLEYTFTAVNGGIYYIDPQATDYLVGLTNSDSATTYVAGNQTYSQGYTGDSVRLICGTDLYWYATDVRGTWTDGN